MRIALVAVILSFVAPFAWSGPSSSGGGDPEALVFVSRLTQAAKIFEQSGLKNIAEPGN